MSLKVEPKKRLEFSRYKPPLLTSKLKSFKTKHQNFAYRDISTDALLIMLCPPKKVLVLVVTGVP